MPDTILKTIIYDGHEISIHIGQDGVSLRLMNGDKWLMGAGIGLHKDGTAWTAWGSDCREGKHGVERISVPFREEDQ